MRMLVIALTLAMSVANAKGVAPKYYVEGQSATPEQAVIAVLSGKSATKCVDVEAKATKTGVSLKPVKAK